MTKLIPTTAQSLSTETVNVLPFCDAYLSDSNFKCCRKLSTLNNFFKDIKWFILRINLDQYLTIQFTVILSLYGMF